MPATIVDGVTKLGKVRFSSATEQRVQNYRKMLLSMPEETRDIYAPLAKQVKQKLQLGSPRNTAGLVITMLESVERYDVLELDMSEKQIHSSDKEVHPVSTHANIRDRLRRQGSIAPS